MAKKKKSKKNFDTEQIQMFIQGSESFLQASVLNEKMLSDIAPQLTKLGSTSVLGFNQNWHYIYSVLNAISANFGMAFELKLKCLQYLSTGHITETHILPDIYNDIDPVIQDKLSKHYEQWRIQEPYPNAFIHYARNAVEIELPSIISLENFVSLLRFFHDIGLYARRYAFENFKPTQWEYVVIPSAFQFLVDRINDVIQDFGNIPSSIKNEPLTTVCTVVEKTYKDNWGTGVYSIDPVSKDLKSKKNGMIMAKNTVSDGTVFNPLIKKEITS